MHVPVQLSAFVEIRVVLREEYWGEPWREIGVDELVEDEGEDDFMDVVGYRWEVEVEGPGLDSVADP